MKTQNFTQLLLAIALFCFTTAGTKAQVIIKGTRVPQLTTAQRNTISAIDAETAKGQVIYNTDNNCLEYWNGLRWVSLCAGNADFNFTDSNDNKVDISIEPNNKFPSEGDTHGPWIPEGVPPCIDPTPYGISVVAGGEYTHVAVLDLSTGKFTVTMEENPTSVIRTAIIRITNNCTNEYKDFLFTQEANNNLCQSKAPKPNIAVDPVNKTACSEGAVYMSISNPTSTDVYIWTYNNVEIARGTWCYAYKKGTYRVYVNAIGCMSNASDEININISGSNAPSPAPSITAENNGIICSGAAGITLTASGYGSDPSKVTWFKDGVSQGSGASKYISSANATDAGNDWIAVISNGGCYSLPSNVIKVKKSSSTALSAPDVTINNLSINAVTFCKGGALNITINNMSAYTGKTVHFIFKNGNNVLNVTKIDDADYQYIVPSTTSSMLFSVTVEENSGTFCNNSVSSSPVELIYSAPSTPTVTSPGTNFLICGATPAVVASGVTGTGYTYTWYKDGVIDVTKTTSSFTTNESGKYAVVITTADGCVTDRSNEVEVKQSGNPAIVTISGASQVNKNDIESYTIAQEAGVTYQWLDGTNGAVLVAPSSSASANYRFEQAGVIAQIKVQATNACGTITKVKDITVTADCTPPGITGGTAANTVINLFEGQMLTLSVNTVGTAPTFQWYKDGNLISGATSATYMKSSVVIADAGTYKVVVTGSGSCSSQTATVDNITVNVVKDPSTNPAGFGTFTGKTCFDVVETNNSGDCGTLTGRSSQKADFSKQAISKQTYTFTTSGTVSKIRFYAVDKTGLVIDYIVPGNSTWETGTNLSGSYTVTVYYKTNLNTNAAGKDRANALTTMLYVVYNDKAAGNGSDKKLELKVSVQDCSCCPGYLATGKEYVQKTAGDLSVSSGANFTTVATYFTATGKDICFFKTDDLSGATSVSTARTTCSSASFTSDSGIKAMGWRLPNLAELGSINSVAGSLSTQATSVSGTANMKNSAASGQNSYYWSTSEKGGIAWGWNYNLGSTQAISVQNNVRCVRTQ